MSGQPWYRHNPRDFLDGVVGMTPDLIGAYIVTLDLIYARGGPIPNDARWLSGMMGCSTRAASSLVSQLIERGKLHLIDGNLSNERARNELETSAKLARNAAETGAKGGRTRAENERQRNKNNDVGQGTLNQYREDKIREEVRVSNDTLSARAKPKRALRCPDDWQPSPLPPALACEVAAMPPGWVERQLAGMRDWSASSPKGAKLDWDATWRGWLRREIERASENGTSGNRPLGGTGQGLLLARPTGTPRQQAVAEILADLERGGYAGPH